MTKVLFLPGAGGSPDFWKPVGSRLPEEYLPSLIGGRQGSAWPDLTFEGPDGSRIRINTVDASAMGVPTGRELDNGNRIFEITGEPIILIPKPRG